MNSTQVYSAVYYTIFRKFEYFNNLKLIMSNLYSCVISEYEILF